MAIIDCTKDPITSLHRTNEAKSQYPRAKQTKSICRLPVLPHLVHGGQNFFRNLLATDKVVITVGQDLRLDDRHDPSALTDGSVTG